MLTQLLLLLLAGSDAQHLSRCPPTRARSCRSMRSSCNHEAPAAGSSRLCRSTSSGRLHRLLLANEAPDRPPSGSVSSAAQAAIRIPPGDHCWAQLTSSQVLSVGLALDLGSTVRSMAVVARDKLVGFTQWVSRWSSVPAQATGGQGNNHVTDLAADQHCEHKLGWQHTCKKFKRTVTR